MIDDPIQLLCDNQTTVYTLKYGEISTMASMPFFYF